VVPTGCQYVTAHIDCHKRVLFYAVAAWSPGFDGSIIDYGAFPKQAQGHFTERTARPTLQDAYPDAGLDGAIRAGVLDLATYLFGRTYERVDGARLSLDMCLVDSGYRRDAVFAAAQDFATRGKLIPSFGRNTGLQATAGRVHRAGVDDSRRAWPISARSAIRCIVVEILRLPAAAGSHYGARGLDPVWGTPA
jgi:hypothetical protein